MSPLQRVAADRAGPSALGVLVPPGRPTFLILRPRALPWDLVLLRPDEPAFHELDRPEAEAAARAVYQALEAWAAGGPGLVEPLPGTGGGWRLRLRLGCLTLLACPRLPGQPYRPLALPDAEAAADAARRLATALGPPPEGPREVYVNTRHFGTRH
jgi:hypothetical protein